MRLEGSTCLKTDKTNPIFGVDTAPGIPAANVDGLSTFVAPTMEEALVETFSLGGLEKLADSWE